MKVIDDDDDDAFDDDERKKSKKPTLAQTIDQVMTIKTHTESSKTELSSRGKRPFKVWRFFHPSVTRRVIDELPNIQRIFCVPTRSQPVNEAAFAATSTM